MQACGGSLSKLQQFEYKEGRIHLKGEHPSAPSHHMVDQPVGLLGSGKYCLCYIRHVWMYEYGTRADAAAIVELTC